MAGEKCGLCDITPLEIADRIIGANELAFAVYLGAEGSLGSCLVVPRRHESSPCGLTEPEVLAIHGLKTRLYQAMEQQWHGIDIDESYRLGPDVFGMPQPAQHLSVRMSPSILNSGHYEAGRQPALDSMPATVKAPETLHILRGLLRQSASEIA